MRLFLPFLLLFLPTIVSAQVTVRNFYLYPHPPALMDVGDRMFVEVDYEGSGDPSFAVAFVIDGKTEEAFVINRRSVPKAQGLPFPYTTSELEVALPPNRIGKRIDEVIIGQANGNKWTWWHRFPVQYQITDGVSINFEPNGGAIPRLLPAPTRAVLRTSTDPVELSFRYNIEQGRTASLSLRPYNTGNPVSGSVIPTTTSTVGSGFTSRSFVVTESSSLSTELRLIAEGVEEQFLYWIDFPMTYSWNSDYGYVPRITRLASDEFSLRIDYNAGPEGLILRPEPLVRYPRDGLGSSFGNSGALLGVGTTNLPVSIPNAERRAVWSVRLNATFGSPFGVGRPVALPPPYLSVGSQLRLGSFSSFGSNGQYFLGTALGYRGRTNSLSASWFLPNVVDLDRPRIEGAIPVGQPIALRTGFSLGPGPIIIGEVSVRAVTGEGQIITDPALVSSDPVQTVFVNNPVLDLPFSFTPRTPLHLNSIALGVRELVNPSNEWTHYYPVDLEVVGPAPAKITALREVIGQHRIEFWGAYGTNYYLERSLSAKPGSWVTVGGPYRGRGPDVAYSFQRFPPRGSDRTFYRLVGYAPALTPVITPVFP